MKQRVKVFCVALLCCWSFAAFAEEASDTLLNITKARAQLDLIDRSLGKKSTTIQALTQDKELLYALEKQAKHCIEENTETLKKLNALSSDVEVGKLDNNNKKNANFLESETAAAKEALADCNLLLYEARKLKKELNFQLETLEHTNRFQKKTPFWELENKAEYFSLPVHNTEVLYKAIGVEKILQPDMLLRTFAILILSFALSFIFYYVLQKITPKKHMAKALLHTTQTYLSLLFPLFNVGLFLDQNLSEVYPKPLILDIFSFLFFCFVLLYFTKINAIILTHRLKKQKALAPVIQKLTKSTNLLIYIITVGSILNLGTHKPIVQEIVMNGYKSFYSVLASSVFLSVAFSALHLAIKCHALTQTTAKLLKVIISAVFITLIAIAFSGYDSFAVFITQHLIKTIISTIFVGEIIYFLWHYVAILNDLSHPISIQLHTWLGLKSNKKFIELTILKFLLSLGMIRAYGYLIFNIWDIPVYYLANILEYLQSDIYILNFNVNLIAIFRGLAAFCIILLFGRSLGAFLARNRIGPEQKNARITIMTLSNYISFLIAIVLALFVAGVNLTGFALVASALSVGIGFGLKGIAADLISGLILLLSKPLRSGDHIEIKETEGFIQKIRLLSTEIKTLDESNVMIPNSSFLEQSVVNYTYLNKRTRIRSQVMLQNVKDVERAKAVMLKVGQSHPDIHQEGKNKPEVLVELRITKLALRIILTLWCVIKDVDTRYTTASNINAEVLAALEKAKIPLKL